MALPAPASMTPRETALEILTHYPDGLSWKAAQFLGNVAGCPDRSLSEPQLKWLGKLAVSAGLIVVGEAA